MGILTFPQQPAGFDSTLSSLLSEYGHFPFAGTDNVTISSYIEWSDPEGYRKVAKLKLAEGAQLRIVQSPFIIFADEIEFGAGSVIHANGWSGSEHSRFTEGNFNKGGIATSYGNAYGGCGGGALVVVARRITGSDGFLQARGGTGSVTATTPHQPISPISPDFNLWWKGGNATHVLDGSSAFHGRDVRLFLSPSISGNSIGSAGGGSHSYNPVTPGTSGARATLLPTAAEIVRMVKLGFNGGGGGRADNAATNFSGPGGSGYINYNGAGGGGGGAVALFYREATNLPSISVDGAAGAASAAVFYGSNPGSSYSPVGTPGGAGYFKVTKV